MMPIIKNITNVRGIKCWGAHTGIKSMRRDLAIIYSRVPANTAAIYTRNNVVAEPLKLTKKHLKNGKAQVIICNSGNANACTGKQGMEGAEAMAITASKSLNVDKEMVVVASTGLIGAPFPTNEIVKGIKENSSKITNNSKAGSFAANAILTTDTFAKEGFFEFDVDGHEINMGGIAKGSGMIHPNMGTMLAFIVTDISIESKLLNKALKTCVDKTFNMITVDGDTSTNDMVVVMANGLAENTEIKSKNDKGYKIFLAKLEEMMSHLAQLIVSDGEGASKFIEYKVSKAKTLTDARKLVRKISDSNLVKAAMFGRDPNWGRIICAAGNAGVNFNYLEADLYIGDFNKMVKVLTKGIPEKYDRNNLKRILKEAQVHIHLVLNTGNKEAIGWGSDLTTDYVLFNSVYTT